MRAQVRRRGFTWWRFCSLFSIWKWRFYSVGGVAEGSRCSRVLVDDGFLAVLTVGFIYNGKRRIGVGMI